MTRVKGGPLRSTKHKKLVHLAKGFRGRSNNNYSLAIERVEKSLQYAYAHRRIKKRSFRSLWIQRISAGCGYMHYKYSTTISNMCSKNIGINRKLLSELAYIEPYTFRSIIFVANNTLSV